MSPRVVAKAQDAEQRRQALVEANANLDEADRLRQVVANMREDVARQETRRDRLLALGDGHIEIAQESYLQEFGVSIAFEPIRSKLTGNQLAAEVEEEIAGLLKEIASVEKRVAELLA